MKARTPGRPRTGDAGVAMVATMLAIFILTIVVAALAIATMGETGISFDQSRSGQAFQLAEAGAYRALAELRYRLTRYLDENIRAAPAGSVSATVNGYCQSNQGWRILVDFGNPVPAPLEPWEQEPANRRAFFRVGTPASPVEVRDAGGTLIGSFYAIVYVRPAENSPPPPPPSSICVGPPSGVESYQMRFDYFVVATAVTRNARRTVCLKTPGYLKSCGEWLASAAPGGPNPGDAVFDSPPATHGFLLLIERASYSQWALMLLNSANVWLFSTSSFPGPVHSNMRFRMWGNPAFGSLVTQVLNDVEFGNGGSPVMIAADQNPPNDVPVYNGPRLMRNAGSIAAPANNNPFWAVLGEDPSRAGQPQNIDVRSATTALPNNGLAVPSGIYFMDECGNPTCGGIFVQGNATHLVLGCEPPIWCSSPGQQQAIYLRTASGLQVKYILESSTNTKECTGPLFATCVDKGKGFNGMIFFNGNLTAITGNPQSGLYGTVHQGTRLTIAANGDITITNHLTYQSPPTSGNDPVPNVLGLYAWCPSPPCARNVTVHGALAPNNLYVDASVLAPWGKFWVQGWNTLPDKGTLHFLGSVVQADFGEWGGFGPGGLTAYGREMIYDQRFLTNTAPPFSPLTDLYTAPRYPRLDPDVLYDRPLWEELGE